MEPVAARQRPIRLPAHATREWFSRVEPTVGLPTAQTTGTRFGHANPIGFFSKRGGSCIVHVYKSKHGVCHTRAVATSGSSGEILAELLIDRSVGPRSLAFAVTSGIGESRMCRDPTLVPSIHVVTMARRMPVRFPGKTTQNRRRKSGRRRRRHIPPGLPSHRKSCRDLGWDRTNPSLRL